MGLLDRSFERLNHLSIAFRLLPGWLGRLRARSECFGGRTFSPSYSSFSRPRVLNSQSSLPGGVVNAASYTTGGATGNAIDPGVGPAAIVIR